jgi:O-antigen/teichoic acid export membrane protein
VNKNSNIQQRAFRNTFVGIVSFILSFAQTIILVPILLKYWGNEKYGVWLALNASFILLQSLDLGHINYIGNKMNITYHIDKNKLKSTLASSLLIAIFIGLIQIFIVIFLIIFNYLPFVLGIDQKLISDYSIQISLLILVTFWIFSGSLGGILSRLMFPTGFYYEYQWWYVLYKFSQFISVLIIVLMDGNILEAVIFYVLLQFIVYGFTFLYIKKKLPEFYPWWRGANFKIGITNFKKSLMLTLNNFIQQLSSNGLLLLISNIFSAIYLPVFSTIRTMTNTALSITNILIFSVLPDFIRYHAEKEKEKLNLVFNANWFFSGFIVNIGLITVVPVAGAIFNIWTNGIISFDYNLFISLAASISIINFGAGLYNYMYGINNIPAITVITITRAITLFGFSYYLSGIMGLSGIGVAVLISEIFSSIILPYVFVQKTLRAFNGSLDYKTSLIAAVPPLIIVTFATSSVFGIKFNYYIWSITLFLIILSYLINWFILDPEVKERTMMLIRKLL